MWKKSGRWRRSVVPNKELSAATTAPLYSSHSVEMYHTRYKRQEASGFIWPHDSSRVLVSDGGADKWVLDSPTQPPKKSSSLPSEEVISRACFTCAQPASGSPRI